MNFCFDLIKFLKSKYNTFVTCEYSKCQCYCEFCLRVPWLEIIFGKVSVESVRLYKGSAVPKD